MRRDLTSRVFVALLLVSIALISSHRLGWMESKFDALGAMLSYSATGASRAEHSALSNAPPFTVRCSINGAQRSNSCGLAFILSYQKNIGVDLSHYNRVDIDVLFVRPPGHERLRLYLKHYSERYSNEADSTSLKYNSVEFSPSPEFEKISIPFDYFQVATWWISKRSISFQDAQFDVENVPVIEFSTGNIATPGEYLISVNEITFYGEWISEFTLYQFLFGIWVMAAVFLLNSHRRLLQKSSYQDALTGTLNRRGLDIWLKEHFVFDQKNIIMFYIDIDDFKRVNDNFGHLVGDALIQGFCRNINAAIVQICLDLTQKKVHTFARLSGDEFVVAFKGMRVNDAENISQRLLHYISQQINVDGRNLKVNASIGVAVNDDSAKTASALIDNADAAMYSSKRRGKNQFRLFDISLSQKMRKQKIISEGLRKSLDHGLFRLAYMPIFSAKSRNVVGVEVLLRCTSDELNGVNQDEYIPIAEEYGLINEIDLWVIEQALKDISTVPEANRLSYNINISSRELHSQDFIGSVQALMNDYKVSSKHILFEITETSLIDADKQSIRFLQHLQSLGFRIALDDFGTGYTSFNQLFEYPAQYLKIDKTFVERINLAADNRASIIDAIMLIARSSSLAVVAEGIETEIQAQYVEELGCDYMQGYYLSEPLTWQDYNVFLQSSLRS